MHREFDCVLAEYEAYKKEYRRKVIALLQDSSLNLNEPGLFTKIVVTVIDTCGVRAVDIHRTTHFTMATIGKWKEGAVPAKGYRKAVVDALRELIVV